MKLDIFSYDSEILKQFKREANILLDSTEIEDFESNTLKAISEILTIADNSSLLDTKDDGKNYKINLFKTIIDFYNIRLLSPINLSDENFIEGVHKRAPFIYRMSNKLIQNKRAKFIHIINSFNSNTKTYSVINKQINTTLLYFSENGKLTGNYIAGSYLKDSVLKKNKYLPKEPIIIKANEIIINGVKLVFVDKNDPKLKTLINTYNTPIYYDGGVAESNIDLIKLRINSYEKQ